MTTKPKSLVIPATAGTAYWQPGVEGNCITIKASPWNLQATNHTVFLHELPYGGEVREHAHAQEDEIFICLEGEGIITLDGQEHAFTPHAVAVITANTKHSIRTVSATPLKFMVVISPPGLEERFKLMGKLKQHPNEPAPAAFTSDIQTKATHGVYR